MRKLWIAGAAAAVIAALTAVGLAFAANTYEVNLASGSPNSAGSPSKPVPSKLNFGYLVGDTDNLRPSVINKYFIASEGVKYFPKAVPTCTFQQANQSPNYASACKKAVVGGGSLENQAGAASDRSQKIPCAVKLTLLNISNGPGVTKKRGGMGIRIDAGPPTCPIPVHGALAAPFFDIKIEGIPTSELRFTVPDNLAHPGGLDNSVIKTVSHVFKKTGKVKINGKTRTVGFASAVGRNGKKRTIRVTFTTEAGQTTRATTTYPK
jgi:hypothetical protein